ncbi:predicted protein [Streptomyces pristinaespiralis ATCC 25486]|uniref:Predicted protein n=1 Tax=Streptomyces pristinaespiralis (strain ATCC 25486 / DSM 40338 / CBS 914.69 / JCM 4507 / KCC S-0507 / NBRC 13074 / NRRL 2958 / 5647) TaxID=457429 RepID=D6X8D1_STRE2|nr:predicted protein [Streptomyces pristinaespiralis ATCC 25486]
MCRRASACRCVVMTSVTDAVLHFPGSTGAGCRLVRAGRGAGHRGLRPVGESSSRREWNHRPGGAGTP